MPDGFAAWRRPIAPSHLHNGRPIRSDLAVVSDDRATGNDQLFAIDPSSGAMRRLTDGTDVDAFAWRPDGTAIALSRRDPAVVKHGADAYRDGFAVTDEAYLSTQTPRPIHLWQVDLAGRARRLTSGTWSVADAPLSWTPDASRLLYMRAPNAIHSLQVYAVGLYARYAHAVVARADLAQGTGRPGLVVAGWFASPLPLLARRRSGEYHRRDDRRRRWNRRDRYLEIARPSRRDRGVDAGRARASQGLRRNVRSALLRARRQRRAARTARPRRRRADRHDAGGLTPRRHRLHRHRSRTPVGSLLFGTRRERTAKAHRLQSRYRSIAPGARRYGSVAQRRVRRKRRPNVPAQLRRNAQGRSVARLSDGAAHPRRSDPHIRGDVRSVLPVGGFARLRGFRTRTIAAAATSATPSSTRSTTMPASVRAPTLPRASMRWKNSASSTRIGSASPDGPTADSLRRG